MSPKPFATTAEVCAAAGVTNSAIMSWAGKGLLPQYEVVSWGRRGRSARWPAHAPAQATWVAGLLRQGYTVEEIKKKLDDGEFVPLEIQER